MSSLGAIIMGRTGRGATESHGGSPGRTTTRCEKKMKQATHKIYVDDQAQSEMHAGLPTTGGIWCLVDRESLCNNIEVSCTTNVEGRLELSEPWIDGITGQRGP